jgi:hypothetical protein
MRAVFLLAAALIFLSPAAALAHGGVPHVEGKTGAAVGSFDQSWSPICPPGSGHVCGCGNLSLCNGSGKPALSGCSSVSFLAADVAEEMVVPETPGRSSPQFPRSLPRAPPQLS